MAIGKMFQGLGLQSGGSGQPRFQLAVPLFVLAVSTGFASFAKPWLGEGYASLIFVVGIMLIGATSGLARAVASALIGAAAFNFYVADPVWQLRFSTRTDFAPPLVFMLCATVSGALSGRLRDQSRLARKTNVRLESLLNVSRDLQVVRAPQELRSVLLEHLSGQPELPAMLTWLVNGRMQPFANPNRPAYGPDDIAVRSEPITDGRTVLGSLIYAPSLTQAGDIAFIAALARLGNLALNRLRLDTEVAEARVLARSEELKTALLSSVSHDLRTPLTTISTAASSLLTFGSALDAQTRNDLLGNIVDECDRLNHLTENLLQMTRLQAGVTQLPGTVLAAQDMIRRCIARLRPHAASRNFVVEAPCEDVLVVADTALFELALLNILQNAVKYSADCSTITVTCSTTAADCVIAITDQGSGIPVNEQPRVFERFYRAERQTPGPKGSGLGLAIAKGFVEASGGSIALASPSRDGRGTTLTIGLPLALEKPLP